MGSQEITNLEAEEAVAACFEPDVAGNLVAIDEFLCAGQYEPIDELPGRVPEGLVIGTVQRASHPKLRE